MRPAYKSKLTDARGVVVLGQCYNIIQILEEGEVLVTSMQIGSASSSMCHCKPLFAQSPPYFRSSCQTVWSS